MCRYETAIRQSMNKLLQNKSSIHRIISGIIAEYSHKILLRPGCYMFGPRREYFVIEDVLSQHWVTGFFCPPRIDFISEIVWQPDLRRRSRTLRKRLFHPFAVVLSDS